MGSVVLVLVVLVLAWFAVSFVRSRRGTLVAKRGLSIGADLGSLSDQPRVRVEDVSVIGSDRVHLVLTPEPGPPRDTRTIEPSDLDVVVSLQHGDAGLDLLQEWRRSAQSLAMVVPPGSHLLRLRSVDDLQPLTLRRVDGN
jgi:hypothetical protein